MYLIYMPNGGWNWETMNNYLFAGIAYNRTRLTPIEMGIYGSFKIPPDQTTSMKIQQIATNKLGIVEMCSK